jgi:hypothetical protein
MYEIPDFRVGRQVRDGAPSPTEPFPVTVIHRHEAAEFFNCRSRDELTRHLRGLRDLGILVHNPGRLTQAVRVGPRERVAAYVFRGRAAELPRRRTRRRVSAR